MSIDLKFMELTADVFRQKNIKITNRMLGGRAGRRAGGGARGSHRERALIASGVTALLRARLIEVRENMAVRRRNDCAVSTSGWKNTSPVSCSQPVTSCRAA